MPYKVPNVLSYSPFGHGGLTRAVANLFGGGKQADDGLRQSQADMNRAHGEYYLSQRDVNNAKIADAERARIAMEDAPRQVAGAIFGNQPQADLWMKSRETGSLPVAEFTTPVGSQMGPSQAQADVIPAQFDPNLVANATRMLTGIAAAKALPGNDNLKHLGDLVGRLYALGVEDDIRGGKMDPTAAAGAGYAAGRHSNEPFKQGSHGMGNVVTGGFADPSLFNAEVNLTGEKGRTEQSKQQENRAQAGAAGAAARLSDARTSEIGRLVPVVDPNDGRTYMVPEGKAGLSVLGRENKKDVAGETAALREPKPGTQAQPRKLTTNDTTLLRNETDELLSSLGAKDADEQTKRAIIAEAERQWQAGAAGHAGAVKAAVDKLAPQGFDRSGFPGFRKSRPVGGAQSGGAITTAPVKISGEADYAALPSGAEFIAPDGTRRRKP